MPSSAPAAAPIRAGAAPGALRPLVLFAVSAALLTGTLLVLRPFSFDVPTSARGVHYLSNFEMPPDIPLTAEAIDAAAATGATPSDLALAGYYSAACLLESPATTPEAQEDGPIFALIDTAATRPGLVIVSSSASAPGTAPGLSSPAPRNVSNAIVLLRTVKGLCRRAETHATEGDMRAATACLDRSRAIATQVLTTEHPTLEALQAVRSLDVLTTRSEVKVMTTLRQSDAARRADARARLLLNFWNDTARPALANARDRREAVMHARADLAPSEAADRDLAADLLRRYAAARVSAAARLT